MVRMACYISKQFKKGNILITLFIGIHCLFLLVVYFLIVQIELCHQSPQLNLIINLRARMAFNIKHYLTRQTLKPMQNHYAFAFSDIKKKTDHFMCAATAIITLTNDRPSSILDVSTSQESKQSSQVVKAWLERKQPFSLREKVVHFINQLQLYQSQNRQEILDFFRLDHDLLFWDFKSQLSIKDGFLTKNIDSSKQEKFVFNPTFAFKELFELLSRQQPSRKILQGNYGIGKSSNQLLANILTTYLFQFRKEGKQVHKDLQESILKNINLLKLIMGFTEQEIQIFNDDKKLVQQIKSQLFGIPLILYYSLPIQQIQQMKYKGVRFKEKDFLRYFTKQQLQKLPKKQSYYLYEKIVGICKKKKIPLSFVIDQSHIFFYTIKDLLTVQKEIKKLQYLPSTKQKEEEQNMLRREKVCLLNKANIYGNFLDSAASAVDDKPNITLTCSENVEYPLQPNLYRGRQNPFTLYSNYFFNKQFSLQNYKLNYGQDPQDQKWQTDIDFVFWFQLESTLINSLVRTNKAEQQFLKDSKIEALNYLKYYYYHLVFKGELKQKNFWQDAARNLLIHQAIKEMVDEGPKSQIRTKIVQIIQKLAEKEQYHKNIEVLKQFTQIIRNLRQKVKQICQNRHQKYLTQYLAKFQKTRKQYFRMLFIFELHQIVRTLKPSYDSNVVLNSVQTKYILKKLKCIQSSITLGLLIDKTFTSITQKDNKITLTFNKSLQQLKRHIKDQFIQIDYKRFFTHLIKSMEQNVQIDYGKRLPIYLLTTQTLNMKIERQFIEQFNIRNQDSLSYATLSFLIKEQKDRAAVFLNVIQQESQQQVLQKYGQDARSFWKCFYSLPEKRIKQIKSKNYENKLPLSLIKDWQRTLPTKSNDAATIQTVFSDIFKLFTEENKAVDNVTFAARPLAKLEVKDEQMTEQNENNLDFDLILLKKKQQKENNKPYKFIAIDVMIGVTEDNYKRILKKFIQFKEYIVLNNLEFFSKIELEFWIICPQIIVRTDYQKLPKRFKKLQEQLDKKIKKNLTPQLLNFYHLKTSQYQDKIRSFFKKNTTSSLDQWTR